MAKNKNLFEKKNVLVLGGAGFIGSHLCDKLIQDNKVICVDNFISGKEANIDHLLGLENFVFLKEDVNNLADLEKYKELERFQIKFQGIQEIYNLVFPLNHRYFDKTTVDTP